MEGTKKDGTQPSAQAGFPGEYPGTYDGHATIDYNHIKIALVGNDSSALGADHNRIPNETISPVASRVITGPLANPVNQRTPTPQGEEKGSSGLHGPKN